MRLLFCIKGLNDASGGAERVLADVTAALADRGHDVTVLSYDAPGGRSYYSLHANVRRVELGIGSTTARATVSGTLRRITALRREVRAMNPEVVVGFMHSMFIPLGLALAGTGIPVIASEHIVPEHYRTRPFEAILLRLTPLVTARIVCVSEQVRRSYPRSLARRMEVIANPVTLTPAGTADVVGRDGERRRVLSVGRLTEQKDHETLIAAFARVAPRLPEWNLRIVGAGERRTQLLAMIGDEGLGDRIELPGVLDDIATEYRAAQLFVIASRYESFGLTTVEAMCHGLPVVGFDDCPGTNKVIRSGVNGVLVRGRGDRVAALADAMERLMRDPDQRRRLSNTEAALPDGWRIENVADQWEILLSRVAADRDGDNPGFYAKFSRFPRKGK